MGSKHPSYYIEELDEMYFVRKSDIGGRTKEQAEKEAKDHNRKEVLQERARVIAILKGLKRYTADMGWVLDDVDDNQDVVLYDDLNDAIAAIEAKEME
jgi:hypothetical protein